MQILFLSRWFPYPPTNGSKLRIYHLLSGLSKHHRVTLISFFDPQEGALQTDDLLQFCDRVYSLPWREYQPSSLHSFGGFFSQMPRYLKDTFSTAMRDEIGNQLASNRFDLVIASQIDMAAYAPFFGQVPAIFEEVEVGVFYENYAHASTQIQRLRAGLTWLKHRRYLESTLDRFEVSTVVSEREAELINRHVTRRARIKVIPNSVDVRSYSDLQETTEPYTMIFTGAFTYEPNYDAMVWFLQNVYPMVREKVPNARLVITGNHAGRKLPCSDGVTLTGFVEDVRPFINRSWCCLAPLQQGGGTRLKILEAMALKTPVVATSKGAEGLDVKHGEHILIADDPIAFAQAILELFEDQKLHESLAENAYNLVREKYNWSAVMPRFLQLVDEAVKVNQ